jgi:hypothetical protein
VRRLDQGFTLSYALFVAIFFAALFSVLYYFGKRNNEFSVKSLYSLQAKYLAESANQRALAMLNTRTLPYSDVLDESADDDDDLDDKKQNPSNNEEEDDEDDDEDEEEDLQDSILEIQPRYLNYFDDELFFINIQAGDIINQDRYNELLAEDKAERANLPQSTPGTTPTPGIEELYLPLPEVNIQYLGIIKIPKYSHFKPGLKIKIADKVKVNFKQRNILQEYFGGPDLDFSLKSKPILRSINPNYAYASEIVDIQLDGENLDLDSAKFTTPDLEIVKKAQSAYSLTLAINEKAKPGTYNLNLAGKKSNFYVLPDKSSQHDAPQIYDIYAQSENKQLSQLVEIYDNDKLNSVKIKGKNLSHDGEAPIIASEASGLQFDILSFTDNEILLNLNARNLPLNNPFTISIFNKGGQSNSWAINVKAKPNNENDLEPNTGIFSTQLTLLQANSLSNLPWAFDPDFEDDEQAGRPGNSDNNAQPGAAGSPTVKKTFNLINSDLETVWLLESIATVNGLTYKESAIVRRTVPQVSAALTANAEVDFSSKDFKIKGLESASAILQDSIVKGDSFIEFRDEFSLNNKDEDDETKIKLDGSAVVESFDLQGVTSFTGTRLLQNFKKSSFVSIISSGSFETLTDFAYVKEVNGNVISLEPPGFKQPHFIRDRFVQFTPAVISTEAISEQDAELHLTPNYSWLSLENINGFQKLTNIVFADLPFLNYFKRNSKDQSPGGYIAKITAFAKKQLEEYFDPNEFFGLNIINGSRSFSTSSPLTGQGILIIDTTEAGRNPQGGKVKISGDTKKAVSKFRGLLYIIGELEISGNFEMTGAIIVKSPNNGSSIQINAEGFIEYNLKEIQKTIFDLPFVVQTGTKKVVKIQEHKFQ